MTIRFLWSLGWVDMFTVAYPPAKKPPPLSLREWAGSLGEGTVLIRPREVLEGIVSAASGDGVK